MWRASCDTCGWEQRADDYASAGDAARGHGDECAEASTCVDGAEEKSAQVLHCTKKDRTTTRSRASRSRKIEPGRYEHVGSGWIVLDYRREYGHGTGWIAFDPNPAGNPWGSAYDPMPTKAQILDQLDEAVSSGQIPEAGS